jgi:hypothetical protein
MSKVQRTKLILIQGNHLATYINKKQITVQMANTVKDIDKNVIDFVFKESDLFDSQDNAKVKA